VSKAACTIKK